jgi:endonuclease/exonuclease/phosphatase (EEP) superfamily protein YafD
MALPVSETRGDARAAAPSRTGSSLARRAAVAAAALYPIGLVAAIAALRIVGERRWVTTVALYLPRIGFALPLPVLLVALWATGARRAVWMLLGASVPLLLVLMGLVLPWPVRAAAGAPTIRVMSYNVDSEIGGVEPLVQEIDRFSPDVVFLEEHGSLDSMVTLLQARYATVRALGQFVVATRFPIASSYDPEKLSYSGRMRSSRWIEEVMDTPLGAVAFFVVHPVSPRQGFYALRGTRPKREILLGGGLPEEGEDAVAGNAGLRAAQVADVARAAKLEEATHPVVIAGDTNLPGLSWVLHRFLDGFQDGFSKAGWGFGYTFPVGKHRPWMRIDRIFASDALRFVRFEVGSSHASDHLSVVADLQRSH